MWRGRRTSRAQGTLRDTPYPGHARGLLLRFAIRGAIIQPHEQEGECNNDRDARDHPNQRKLKIGHSRSFRKSIRPAECKERPRAKQPRTMPTNPRSMGTTENP